MLFSNRSKLEHQLMDEIKSYAGVKTFPLEDAKRIAQLLEAYNRGNGFVDLMILASGEVLKKYPDLYSNWDQLMIKYKKLGLFPNWQIIISEEPKPVVKTAKEIKNNKIVLQKNLKKHEDFNRLRYDLEQRVLPRLFYAETEAFVDGLSENPAMIYDLFSETAKSDHINFPYKAADFHAREIPIDDNLNCIHLAMPKPGRAPLAYDLYFVFDDDYQNAHYFILESSLVENTMMLCKRGINGNHLNYGSSSRNAALDRIASIIIDKEAPSAISPFGREENSDNDKAKHSTMQSVSSLLENKRIGYESIKEDHYVLTCPYCQQKLEKYSKLCPYCNAPLYKEFPELARSNELSADNTEKQKPSNYNVEQSNPITKNQSNNDSANKSQNNQKDNYQEKISRGGDIFSATIEQMKEDRVNSGLISFYTYISFIAIVAYITLAVLQFMGVSIISGLSAQRIINISRRYPSYRFVSQIYGLFLLCMAFFVFHARRQLMQFKRGTLWAILIVFFLNMVGIIVHNVAIAQAVPPTVIQMQPSTIIFDSLLHIVLIVINYVYFSSRSRYFSNQ